MNIRIMLFIAALFPLSVFADKGDFTFKVGDSVTDLPSSCIKSVGYTEKNEIDSEEVNVDLTTECGHLLSQVTRQNIGKIARFSYRGNLMSSATIISVLGSNFRISSKESPRVVLMQMLNDYGTAND
ncbi:SecDF P1 head subdomain-containing protein [Kosakonia oryzendophytica]|uniref:SecDF P1 head subdomain-containing protein n=1 Tax=Kosakonia oryzendophytica TaxID=1005665 RepID=UPI003D331E94